MGSSDKDLLSRYVILDPRPLGRLRVSRRTLSVGTLLLLPLVIALGCLRDGTWRMVTPAIGLADHYGFWAIFVTSPAILLLSVYLLRVFVNTIEDIDRYCSTGDCAVRAKVGELVANHVKSLSLGSDSRWILVFIVIVMTSWCVLNVQKTIRPELTYGHDVFDAYAHPWGFYPAKLYVFIVFGLVYAVAVFVALHVTFSMVSILRFLRRNDALKVDLFHSDNCGGTSQFGNINLLVLAIYLNFFVVIYCMYETHRTTYLVMVASLIACSILAMLQSVFAVYYIHRVVSERKAACIIQVTERLNDAFAGSLTRTGKFPTDLLTLRNHVMAVNSFPYVKGAAAAVNFIRFAPAAVAFMSYVHL